MRRRSTIGWPRPTGTKHWATHGKFRIVHHRVPVPFSVLPPFALCVCSPAQSRGGPRPIMGARLPPLAFGAQSFVSDDWRAQGLIGRVWVPTLPYQDAAHTSAGSCGASLCGTGSGRVCAHSREQAGRLGSANRLLCLCPSGGVWCVVGEAGRAMCTTCALFLLLPWCLVLRFNEWTRAEEMLI